MLQLPDRARDSSDRAAAGVVRVRGAVVHRDARRRPAVLPRRARRLGAGARSDRAPTPELLLAELGRLGEVTARAAQRARLRPRATPPSRPRSPARRRSSLLTATIDEEIERMFVRLPDDERVAPIAGRGQDVREQIAAAHQLGVGGRLIRTHGDYHLGQTLHIPGRLADHRLRGRAGAAAVRAPPEALAAARRRRDAALVRLRRPRPARSCAGSPRRPTSRSARGGRSSSATSRRSTRRCCRRARRRSSTCCRSSSSRRRSTSSSTSSTTGPTGCRSRSPGSLGCWTCANDASPPSQSSTRSPGASIRPARGARRPPRRTVAS